MKPKNPLAWRARQAAAAPREWIGLDVASSAGAVFSISAADVPKLATRRLEAHEIAGADNRELLAEIADMRAQHRDTSALIRATAERVAALLKFFPEAPPASEAAHIASGHTCCAACKAIDRQQMREFLASIKARNAARPAQTPPKST